MNRIGYRYRRFPPAIVQRAVWLYTRYSLSLRGVEEMLAERGIEVSHETIRRWVARFGPPMANRLRRSRPRAHPQWHSDEMFTTFNTRRHLITASEHRKRRNNAFRQWREAVAVGA